MRFDMLKKPATAEISQMSRSEKPARRSRSRSAFLHAPGRGRELDREIEHGALALVQPRHAIVHHHLLAEQRIAGILPHRGAVRGEAVVAAVLRRHRDRDHLALELGKPALAQHQVVVHGDEGFELRHVEGIGQQHVGHEAEFVLAFLEIGGHGGRELRRRQIERDHRRVVGRRRGGFERDRLSRVAGLPADARLPMACSGRFVLAALPAALSDLLGLVHLPRPVPVLALHKITSFCGCAIRPCGAILLFYFMAL